MTIIPVYCMFLGYDYEMNGDNVIRSRRDEAEIVKLMLLHYT